MADNKKWGQKGLPFLASACLLLAVLSTSAFAIQITTLSYGTEGAQVLDLYTPDNLPGEPMPTVILAHGGLWQSGGRYLLETLCNNIVSRSGGAIACASIDYRLSDDLGGVCTGTGIDTYTDQAGDMALAYALLQSRADEYGLDPRRMHVGGHSAGAHLANILNLRWTEFAQPCNRPGGCPAALSAIGLEGIYNIPAWNDYDVSRWQWRFECATRKAFGASGPSPEACFDEVLGVRCWDAGSPIYLVENAGELGTKPAGDALLIQSPGDDWVDIAQTRNLGTALMAAFPDIDVVTETDGNCAIGQHNDVLGETSMADCMIEFINGRVPPLNAPRQLTAGFNDAWYNPLTDGQGFFITVFPDLAVATVAWFTYDTELPPTGAQANLGDAGHRWLTASGPIEGNRAVMAIEMTSGGLFDTTTVITRTDPAGSDGSIILTFENCNSGTVDYDIPSINKQGSIPIQRVASDNIAMCELLDTRDPQIASTLQVNPAE